MQGWPGVAAAAVLLKVVSPASYVRLCSGWVPEASSGPDYSFVVCLANTFTAFPVSRHPCGPQSMAVWEGEATRAVCLSQVGKCSLCPSDLHRGTTLAFIPDEF